MINRNVLCADYAENNGDVFLSLWDLNAICKLNKEKNTVDVIGRYEGFKCTDHALTGQVIMAGNKCFFSPNRANAILVYDTNNETMTSISLSEVVPAQNELYAGGSKFWSAVKTDRYVYMFGFFSPTILKIDISTLEIYCLAEWVKKLPMDSFNKTPEERMGYFGNGHVKKEEKIYIPSARGTGVWEIILATETIHYIPLRCDFKGFHSIGAYKEYLVLTSSSIDEDKIVLWDQRTNGITNIQLPVRCLWHTPVTFNGDLYLFPISTNGYILKISEENYRAETFERLDILMETEDGLRDSVLSVKTVGSKVSFIRVSDQCWFTYDFAEDILDAQYYEIEDSAFLEDCMNEIYDSMIDNITTQNIFVEVDIPLVEFMKRI